MSQWAGMAYWRTPELEVGGAWQGWDTKCSAELLASHWLTVKLRFAGGTREMGATGPSGSTTRQAYMEPWLLYTQQTTRLPLCLSVSLAAVGCCGAMQVVLLLIMSNVSFHPSAAIHPQAPWDEPDPF